MTIPSLRLLPVVCLTLLLPACAGRTQQPDAEPKRDVTLVKPILPTPPLPGLDGRIARVTTLAPDGAGSLRRAVSGTGPRLVVFEVGGVIDLAGRSITIREPFLTIAGQTAPDPGITLIRGSMTVETHDVAIQHIAVRPGDRRPGTDEWAPDAMGVRRADKGPVYNVLFDHCSATWAIDENLSTSGPGDVDADAPLGTTAHHVTLRSCLIAEALSHATHPKGEHSKGTLVHDGVRDVEITGCLYAHNLERNPRLKGATTTSVIGNVMYNWGSACVGIGARGNERVLQPAEAVIVGNFAIAGPDTRGRMLVKGLDPGGRVYLSSNTAVDASGKPLAMTGDGVVTLAAPPSWSHAFQTSSASSTLESVLRSAGSRPAQRDPIDRRIVQSVIDGTGRIIDSQEDVGGYPVRASTTRALTVPDGAAERATWLEKLARELDADASVDVAPLRKRLGRSQ